MKILLFTMVLIAPLTAGSRGGGRGCKPTHVSVPYPNFKASPIYTPSIVPSYNPLDISVPVVKRCPSVYPYPPFHYGGGRPYFGRRGGIKNESNSNVIKGVIAGSKVNMSNKGVYNVQSNSDKKVFGGGHKKHRKKPCPRHGKKHRPRPCKRPYICPFGGYGGIKNEKNVNQIQGAIYGSSINMSNGGRGNVQANSKKLVKKGKKKRPCKKGLGATE